MQEGWELAVPPCCVFPKPTEVCWLWCLFRGDFCLLLPFYRHIYLVLTENDDRAKLDHQKALVRYYCFIGKSPLQQY